MTANFSNLLGMKSRKHKQIMQDKPIWRFPEFSIEEHNPKRKKGAINRESLDPEVNMKVGSNSKALQGGLVPSARDKRDFHHVNSPHTVHILQKFLLHHFYH